MEMALIFLFNLLIFVVPVHHMRSLDTHIHIYMRVDMKFSCAISVS